MNEKTLAQPGDILLTQDYAALPAGGRVDTYTIDTAKPEGKTAYYTLSFKAKVKDGRFNYWWMDFFDKDGNVLADVNSKLYQSDDWREYEELFQAESKAVKMLPAFCLSKQGPYVKKCGVGEFKDIVLKRVSDDYAAAWCDRVYRSLPQVDWVAPKDCLWRLTKTWDKLVRHKPLKIIMLGGSLCNDTYNGQVSAQLKRDFPLSDIEVIASVRGGTGVWYYEKPEMFKKYVLDYNPDLVLVCGICHRGPVDNQPCEQDRELYFQRFINLCKMHDLELALCTPPMSKDFRSTTDIQDFDPVKTDPAIIDRTLMDNDYLYRLGMLNNVPVWNCTFAPYQALAQSGEPLEAWMRDIVHCDDRAKQLNARALVAHFRTAIYYAYPEARNLGRLWRDWAVVTEDGKREAFDDGATKLAKGTVITQMWKLIEDPENLLKNDLKTEYSATKPVQYTARFFNIRGTELESSKLELPATGGELKKFETEIPLPDGAAFVRHSFAFEDGLQIKSFGICKHRLREG